eukprot:m.96776 g.96776  ORF g.96776 m.96776 type:complete len:1290 (-) comp13084_c2_seq3:1386-5255(-)
MTERDPLLHPEHSEERELRLLRACTFVEDGLNLRNIYHKQDRGTLKLRRLYYHGATRGVLLLVCIVQLCLALFEDPMPVHRHPSEVSAVAIVDGITLLILVVDVVVRMKMYEWSDFKAQRPEVFHLVVVTLGVIGYSTWFIKSVPAWHRIIRPAYLFIRWRHMRSLTKVLVTALVDVFPLILLLASLTGMFATIGMLVFPDQEEFDTWPKAFLALLYFMTGSNAPALSLKYMHKSEATYIFYTAFFAVTGILVLSVILALVFSKSESYIQMVAHRAFRKRCIAFRLAFECLEGTDEQTRGAIDQATMADMLRLLWGAENEVILVALMLLDKDHDGTIDPFEFASLFELTRSTISQVGGGWTWFRHKLGRMSKVITRGWFSLGADMLLLVNAVMVAVQVSISEDNIVLDCKPFCVPYAIFATVFLIDKVLCVVVMGPRKVLWSLSKALDFLFVLAIFIGQMDALDTSATLIPLWASNTLSMLRVFRLLRPLARVSMFKTLFSSVASLIAHIPGLFGLIMTVYYVYAEIGMAVLSNHLGDLPVLHNTSYYKDGLDVFNFNSFGSSLVVLWLVQTQTSGWHEVLDASIKTRSTWIVIFYFSWLLTTVILVMNVFVALVIDVVSHRLKGDTIKTQRYAVTTGGNVIEIDEEDLNDDSSLPPSDIDSTSDSDGGSGSGSDSDSDNIDQRSSIDHIDDQCDGHGSEKGSLRARRLSKEQQQLQEMALRLDGSSRGSIQATTHHHREMHFPRSTSPVFATPSSTRQTRRRTASATTKTTATPGTVLHAHKSGFNTAGMEADSDHMSEDQEERCSLASPFRRERLYRRRKKLSRQNSAASFRSVIDDYAQFEGSLEDIRTSDSDTVSHALSFGSPSRNRSRTTSTRDEARHGGGVSLRQIPSQCPIKPKLKLRLRRNSSNVQQFLQMSAQMRSHSHSHYSVSGRDTDSSTAMHVPSKSSQGCHGSPHDHHQHRRKHPSQSQSRSHARSQSRTCPFESQPSQRAMNVESGQSSLTSLFQSSSSEDDEVGRLAISLRDDLPSMSSASTNPTHPTQPTRTKTKTKTKATKSTPSSESRSRATASSAKKPTSSSTVKTKKAKSKTKTLQSAPAVPAKVEVEIVSYTSSGRPITKKVTRPSVASASARSTPKKKTPAKRTPSQKEGSNGSAKKSKPPQSQQEQGEMSELDQRNVGKTAFQYENQLSPELAEFLGVEFMSRANATKKLWEYIKEKDLPKKSGVYQLDETLQRILKRKTVSFKTMSKVRTTFTSSLHNVLPHSRTTTTSSPPVCPMYHAHLCRR